MSDTTRVVLIAAGVTVLVVLLLPLLFMSGMMAGMTNGVMGGGPWLMVVLPLLVLVVGAALFVAGLQRR